MGSIWDIQKESDAHPQQMKIVKYDRLYLPSKPFETAANTHMTLTSKAADQRLPREANDRR